MNARRRHTAKEVVRNIFFIAIAIITVAIFFNLDIVNKGESLFSRNANTEIKFSGDLGYKDYTQDEIQRLRNYLKTRRKLIQEIKIEASPQDTYKAIKPTTDILFEIHVIMKDGFTFTTPLRRAKRQDLAKRILSKLNKDVQAYIQLKKEGKKAKSMVNTM